MQQIFGTGSFIFLCFGTSNFCNCHCLFNECSRGVISSLSLSFTRRIRNKRFTNCALRIRGVISRDKTQSHSKKSHGKKEYKRTRIALSRGIYVMLNACGSIQYIYFYIYTIDIYQIWPGRMRKVAVYRGRRHFNLRTGHWLEKTGLPFPDTAL